jgi:hypothetical protein
MRAVHLSKNQLTQSMETTNYYTDKSRRQFVNGKKKVSKLNGGALNGRDEKWKETAKDVGKDLLIGVLGGGAAAATVGRSSFIVGLVISTYGHHTENKSLAALGLGMMSSASMTALNSDGKTPELPERLKLFQEELKRKLFVDKLVKLKLPQAVQGIESSLAENLSSIPSPSASDFVKLEENERITGVSDKVENSLQKDYADDNNDDEWDLTSSGRIY